MRALTARQAYERAAVAAERSSGAWPNCPISWTDRAEVNEHNALRGDGGAPGGVRPLASHAPGALIRAMRSPSSNDVRSRPGRDWTRRSHRVGDRPAAPGLAALPRAVQEGARTGPWLGAGVGGAGACARAPRCWTWTGPSGHTSRLPAREPGRNRRGTLRRHMSPAGECVMVRTRGARAAAGVRPGG